MSRAYSRRDLFRRFRNRDAVDQSSESGASSQTHRQAQPESDRPMPTNPQAAALSERPHPAVSEGASSGKNMILPELCQSLLDEQTLDQLFRDLAACTRVLEVIPKHARRGYVQPAGITLAEGYELIKRGAVRAVQIRYRYDGAEWWDTLIHTGAGVRIVRIRHEFEDRSAS